MECLARNQEPAGPNKQQAIWSYIVLPAVSGTHARLEKKGGSLLVTDLDSTNGTYINERRLNPGFPIAIDPGSFLIFGLYWITQRFPSNSSIFREVALGCEPWNLHYSASMYCRWHPLGDVPCKEDESWGGQYWGRGSSTRDQDRGSCSSSWRYSKLGSSLFLSQNFSRVSSEHGVPWIEMKMDRIRVEWIMPLSYSNLFFRRIRIGVENIRMQMQVLWVSKLWYGYGAKLGRVRI